MSVLIETGKGDFVIDLYTKQCPNACLNFLKLCKIKHYNNNKFFNVRKEFAIECGKGSDEHGNTSVFGIMYGRQARYFKDEITATLTHDRIGVVSMSNVGENMNASQFFIMLSRGHEYLDSKHTIIGQVVEGLDVLAKIGDVPVNKDYSPSLNIRIHHTIVLDDPFEDPKLLPLPPPPSPPPPAAAQNISEVEDCEALINWMTTGDNTTGNDDYEELARKRDAQSRAQVLEMIGDLPDAQAEAVDTALFVCQLNRATTASDLQTIFSRFGTVVSCEILKDKITHQSLCYGFVEYQDRKSCELAFQKMDNAIIDDKRIKVDFSQSVSRSFVLNGKVIRPTYTRKNTNTTTNNNSGKQFSITTGKRPFQSINNNNNNNNKKS